MAVVGKIWHYKLCAYLEEPLAQCHGAHTQFWVLCIKTLIIVWFEKMKICLLVRECS